VTRISVELPDDLAALLKQRAEADDLTVAQLVRRALRSHLKPLAVPMTTLPIYTDPGLKIWCESGVNQ
jgi:plasmid stability protein